MELPATASGGSTAAISASGGPPVAAAAEAPAAPIARMAWEGCSVLLDINDGDRLAFARLSPAATMKIGNKSCPLAPLVGCPFGSLFRVEAGPGGPRLVRCVAATATSAPSSQDDCMQESVDGPLQNETRDNRSLVDNNTAQSLSSDDIDAMRRDGASGDEIVEALIANSSTFGKKTTFSQEKYKLKKQKKYAPKVLLRRPCTRSICETYFKKHPARIGFLRVDALSLLLSMANAGAYSDVLVVDMVGGLLVGAIAERLGGTGYVCSTHFGLVPNSIDIVRMFNFSNDVCSRIVQAPFSELCSSQNSGNTSPVLHDDKQSPAVETNVDESIQSPMVKPSEREGSEDTSSKGHLIQEDSSLSECGGNDCGSTVSKPVKPGRPPSPETIKSWKENGFSSLIVAAPELEVGSFIADLLSLLSYSAPFAIYHQYLQPLATCMHSLQVSKMAIGLQISEPWLREYQVLPSRTHPHMQMNAFGGYILSGIRIHSGNPFNGDPCNGNK